MEITKAAEKADRDVMAKMQERFPEGIKTAIGVRMGALQRIVHSTKLLILLFQPEQTHPYRHCGNLLRPPGPLYPLVGRRLLRAAPDVLLRLC